MSSTKKLAFGFGIAVVFLALAAVGFAQQDGLQPPPGPVTDTQPSLFSLGESLAAIEASIIEPPSNELLYAPSLPLNSSVALNADRVRIERIIVNTGVVSVRPQGVEIARFVASQEPLNAPGTRVEPFTAELGIELDGPIEFLATDSNITTTFIVVYRELP